MRVVERKEWSFAIHERGSHRTAEVVAEGVVVHTAEDVLDMLASVLWIEEAQHLVLHEGNVTPQFFDLTTGVLGDILQKCSNYRFRLALVGEFDKYGSNSLRAFIAESNRSGHVLFVKTLEEALERLTDAD